MEIGDLSHTAKYWDIVWARPIVNYERHHQLFWKLIKENSVGKILDLACGSASCWKDTDLDITGIDISEEGIKLAQTIYPNGRFLVGDIANTGLDEQFDTIVLCGVVNYYRDLEPIKKEVLRLKRDNGRVIITINVIKDFEDRTWNESLIFKEFECFGSTYNIEFHDKVGWFIRIDK